MLLLTLDGGAGQTQLLSAQSNINCTWHNVNFVCPLCQQQGKEMPGKLGKPGRLGQIMK